MNILTPEQLDQLEYLISQSAVGNHVLFEKDEIRKTFDPAFGNPQKIYKDIDLKKMDVIHTLMSELFKKPTLIEKKNYIDALQPELRELLIWAYFNVLDNTLYQHRTELQ